MVGFLACFFDLDVYLAFLVWVCILMKERSFSLFFFLFLFPGILGLFLHYED